MEELKATKTYDIIDGKVIHNGYFIYGKSTRLQWVSIKNVEEI